jgi:hypothetical protein
MANYRPIVIIAGVLTQLPDTDSLYAVSLDVNGSPITDTLIGEWNAAYGWGDHDGLYDDIGEAVAQVALHESAYDHAAYDTVVTLIGSPTADNQILQATGVGTAAWTTDVQALTSLVVDDITLDGSVATIDQHYIGEVNNNRLEFTSDRTDGGGGIFDFKCTGAVMDATDYNLLYVWSNNTSSNEYFQFGYQPSGVDRYIVHSYDSGGAPVPIKVEFNSVAAFSFEQFDSTYNRAVVPTTSEFRVDTDEAVTAYGCFSDQVTGTQTGTMKINLGRPYNEAAMCHYVIDGFNYTGTYEGPWKLMIGFYDTGGIFYARGCSVEGDPPFQSVRLAVEAGTIAVLLGLDGQTAGETATTWNFPWICVNRVTAPTLYGDEDIIDTKGSWSMEFSDDEATDWTDITYEINVPISIGPGCTVEDQGNGKVKLLVNSLELTAPEVGNTPAIIDSTYTIYVKTTGNDSSGDGSSSNPYATLGRAFADTPKLIPTVDVSGTPENIIIIDVEAGHYNEPYTINPLFPYGGRLYVIGDYQDCDGSTATSYGSVTFSGTTDFDYIDISGVLAAGTTATVGDYLVIMSATGGTNAQLVEGCHEITAWNSGTRAYTARVMRRSSVTAAPSGTITLTTAHVSKTIVSWSGKNGVVVAGMYWGGAWRNVTLVGDGGYTGFWCLNGGKAQMDEHFSMSNWLKNVHVSFAGYAYMNDCALSFGTTGIQCSNSAGMNAYTSVMNGFKTYAINCSVGSTVQCGSMRIHTSGNAASIICYSHSYVDISSGYVSYPKTTTTYASTYRGGGVDFTSATLTGGTTATADAYSYIVGP